MNVRRLRPGAAPSGWLLILAAMLLAAVGIGIAALLLQTARDAIRGPVFFGVSDGEALRDGTVRRAAGRVPQLVNVFVKLDSAFSTATLVSATRPVAIPTSASSPASDPPRVTPMVSLEPWSWRSRWGQDELPAYRLATIIDGRHDLALQRIARAVGAYPGPVLVRFAHEMNGWWYPWAEGVNGNRSGDYVRAWNHVQAVFRSVGASNVSWVWAPNALTRGGREEGLAGLFPGDNHVDYVGFSAYGHGRTAAADLQPTYRALTRLSSRPVLLAETGADGPAQANWIRSLSSWLEGARRVEGFVWYPTRRADGASGDYRFDGRPGSEAAMRDLLGALVPAERAWTPVHR